jgi:hypothetical protein
MIEPAGGCAALAMYLEGMGIKRTAWDGADGLTYGVAIHSTRSRRTKRQ